MLENCLLCSREKERLQKALCQQIYGNIPNRPKHLSVELCSFDRHFVAGQATLSQVKLICDFGSKQDAIPLGVAVPNDEKVHPVIIFLSFDGEIPGKYLPAEEIIDRGYAIINLNLTHLSGTDESFKRGVCANLSVSRRAKDAPGKIALWTWGVMRVIDSLSKIDGIDSSRVIVAAHSLLGRVALLAGAFDDRISCVIANDSYNMGCVGGAEEMCRQMPQLFCPRYRELVSGGEAPGAYEISMKLCLGRKILVSVAEDDPRSNPGAELQCIEKLITKGAKEDGFFYRSRRGSHYLSVADWKAYLDYLGDFDNNSLHI